MVFCGFLALMMIFACGVPSSVYAQSGNAAHDMGGVSRVIDERSLFDEVLRDIKAEKWQSAGTKMQHIKNPLFRKLYSWLYYLDKENEKDFDKLTKFIQRHPDWPLQRRLELRVEAILNDQVEDHRVVAWFREHAPQTTSGMRHYAKSLEQLGKKNELKIVLRQWWRDAKLSAPDQKYFIDHYGYYFSRAAHIDRLDMLLTSRHYTNAREIAARLGVGYPALAEARIALREDKGGVDDAVKKVPDYLKDNPGLLYERITWRRRHDNDEGAIKLLEKIAGMENISSQSRWWKERNILARHLINEKEYKRAYDLVSNHKQTSGFSLAQAEFLSGWLALQFLNQPYKAFEHFERLYHNVATPISRARGAYWAGRASDSLGHPDIAREWYRTAARHQTAFYGQLAIAALDNKYKPPQQLPPERDLRREAEFKKKDLVQAAKVLSRNGYRKEATYFLEKLSDNVIEEQDYLLVAELSRDLDRFDNAIRIAKNGLKRNIFLMDHAYPTIVSRLRKVDTEWALVHALIRQESAFDYKAQSPAGARGLMQIMPATARNVARRIDVRHQTRWLTSDPNHNIKLGTAYLDQMIERFNGSYPLALAAYNAGPTRVDRWIKKYGDPRIGEIGMVDWIELIPIYETRNYVQRVMEGLYVYRLKLRHMQKNIKPTVHMALTHQ